MPLVTFNYLGLGLQVKTTNCLKGMKSIEKHHKSSIPYFSLIDGLPNINGLNMLILKNKLDTWKKEVRLLGYTPKININYVKNQRGA